MKRYKDSSNIQFFSLEIMWKSTRKLKDAKARGKIIKNPIHDVSLNSQKKYMLPIYSKTGKTYQFDILVPSKSSEGIHPYFLILININSRKAFAYHMRKKSSNTVLKALQLFYRDVKGEVHDMTSDQDKAFLSNKVVEWMLDNNIKYHTTQMDNHNILGIINRFIETLRDMNDGHRDFTKEQMKRCIEEYNESIHSSIETSPDKFNEQDNKAYIKEKDELTENIKKLTPRIHDDDKVRIQNEANMMEKKRMNFFPEVYKVDGRDGNNYIVKAKDNSIASLPRYKITPGHKDFRLGLKLHNDSYGVVEKIIEHLPDKKKYKVLYEGGEKRIEPMRNLRHNHPTEISIEEMKYWNKQDEIPIRSLRNVF